MSAPQTVAPLGRLVLEPIVGKGWIKGDNYLTLNVWAPENGKKLPVMVYIHGGAFTLGSKDASVYNGTSFAKSGVVCVNINYRLGIDGFLAIPGVPTNLGLRDMLFALEWVKENVIKFGGDPQNVTIFGESAGGTATACLVVSPLSKGLFSKAIIQSGPAVYVQSKEISLRVVNELAKKLKIKPEVYGFASVSPEDCLEAISKIAKPGKVNLKNENGIDVTFGSKFSHVFGDDVLPEQPIILLRKGAGKEIPLLITTTSNEANIFLVPTDVLWV